MNLPFYANWLANTFIQAQLENKLRMLQEKKVQNRIQEVLLTSVLKSISEGESVVSEHDCINYAMHLY